MFNYNHEDAKTLERTKQIFEETGAVFLQNFLTKDACAYMCTGFETILEASKYEEKLQLRLEKKGDGVIVDSNDPNVYDSVALYGTEIAEVLSAILTPVYSKMVGKNLAPTYTYMRRYSKHQFLPNHTDRHACQYSMSIDLSWLADQPWDFNIVAQDRETHIELPMMPGDAVIYKGMEVLHGREELTTRDQSYHVFLHWVDRDDKAFQRYIFDNRKYITLPDYRLSA